ncbi:MAG: sugar MFS transporter [Opitutales bacterium]|nr:sugar MFS transporter [Opitutales bacterium]
MEGKSKFSSFYMPMAILASLYAVMGLLSWVNAMLIPYFKTACELTHTQAYFVTLAFYIAYFAISAPASKLLDRVGYKRGIAIGLWAMSAGALVFVPAACAREYYIFLAGLFTIGTGLAVLQTAANPYVTNIGPIETATRRISIMGLGNKAAGIIAPLLFAVAILKPEDKRLFEALDSASLVGAAREAALDELIGRVVVPYSALAAFLFLFGCLVMLSKLPELNLKGGAQDSGEDRSSPFAYPYLVFGVLAIFFHVASQIVAIDTVINYAKTMGIDMNSAKIFPMATLGFTFAGYVAGIILIPRVASQKTMLQICVVLGALLSCCVMLFTFDVELFGLKTNASIWFICLLGLPNSLIFAGIWPLAIRGLGKWTNRGSSLMVMALCGNAVMPLVYGIIADKTDPHFAYIVLLPCFAYLIFFAFRGYKIEKWKGAK